MSLLFPSDARPAWEAWEARLAAAQIAAETDQLSGVVPSAEVALAAGAELLPQVAVDPRTDAGV